MRGILALVILLLGLSSAAPEPEYSPSLIFNSFQLVQGNSPTSLVEIESSIGKGDRLVIAALPLSAQPTEVQLTSNNSEPASEQPSPPGDPIAFAARLLGQAPPPEIAFADAAASMSPMALSFWQDCRRVKNDKLKRELGVALHYPTYREGLRALFEEK